MIAPGKYIQGQDVLLDLGELVLDFADRALLVATKDGQNRVQHQLNLAMKKKPFVLVPGEFRKECTPAEIERLKLLAEQNDCGVIVGLGGGKAIDTAKAVASAAKKPVIIVPTIASTDAPTSRLAIIYSESHEFEQFLILEKNPDIVLVDTRIIANAPVRFLVAGMGDAMSTFFEARSCLRSNADNMSGGKSTKAAFAIAQTCYETLLSDSVMAKAACQAQVVTPALENIVEANILLSGLGFESSGLAACHSVHNGLTQLADTHHCYHGEKVAFGVITHLVLENAAPDELNTVINYFKTVGLPTCLKDLGIIEPTKESLMKVATAACAEGETIHNMPFPVTAENVYAAILVADSIGS